MKQVMQIFIPVMHGWQTQLFDKLCHWCLLFDLQSFAGVAGCIIMIVRWDVHLLCPWLMSE